MLLDPSLYISCDPGIECVVCTTEDVGKIGNRKEEIGDKLGIIWLSSKDLDIHDIAYLSYSVFLIGELDTTSTQSDTRFSHIPR
jgi:hypothetical protein